MSRPEETWLVTGASGCIGSWTVLALVREGVEVVALSRRGDDRRLRVIASEDELARVDSVRADITELGMLEDLLAAREVSHIVHLAALQAPFCRADPPLGAQINVAGTTNVLEAARRHGLRTPVVYASSAAVYDAAGEAFTPTTVYGVYKVANEGSARIYWQDHGLASVGLRPHVVYGPGRDQGMTAAPTEAMLAAARGDSFRIPFGGSTQMHYAPDVARAFVDAARRPATGADVFNLGGPTSSVAEIVDAIVAVVPSARITFDDVLLPFASRLPEPWFPMPQTPLRDGVRETIQVFALLPVASPGE
jgi:UDP-glucuronate 4-epimerase